MKKRFAGILDVVHFLEVFLATIIITIVIINGIGLLAGIYRELTQGAAVNLQESLSSILLLVIGLELAVVLIKHTPESVLQVVIFAVARKILISAEASFEIAVGVAALAVLFAVRKHFLLEPEGKGES